MDTIKFTKAAIKAALDKKIKHWRKERLGTGKNSEIAIYYVDAYQSMRMAIFGEMLSRSDNDE